MLADGLLILGMHRSGTSAVAGQLAALGIYPGRDLLPGQADNPKGFFEPRAVVELHDEILKLFGATWDDPRPLPQGWQTAPALAPYQERLAALIQSEYGSARNWFVKDPRLCRLLPLWQAVLTDLDVRCKVLIVVRDPGEVVASLKRRNRTDIEQGASLWLAHYAEAEMASRGFTRALVFYQDWLTNWRDEAARVFSELGLGAVPDGTADFAEPALRHQYETALPVFSAPQNAWVAGFYQALLAWRRDNISASDTAEAVAEDLMLSARAALPVLAYLREADARAHAAELRTLKAACAPPAGDIFMIHFLREAERAAGKAQSLAHERLLLINQIQASASWKVTQPLRALKRLIGRLTG